MNTLECATWNSFKQVVNNFLGNTKTGNHTMLVSNMTEAFQKFAYLMSIKIHFLSSHILKFLKTIGGIATSREEASIRTSTNGGEIPGKVGRNHDDPLLLVAKERQTSCCSDTEIEETPIYAVNSKIFCHVMLIQIFRGVFVFPFHVLLP